MAPSRAPRLTSILLGLCLALAPAARAQGPRAELSGEQRVELEAAEDQARVGSGLYIAGAVVGGAGLLTLLGASIHLGVCARCTPGELAAGEIALGTGAAVAGLGLVAIVIGIVIADDAESRRREVLRRSVGLTLAPLPGGAVALLTIDLGT